MSEPLVPRPIQPPAGWYAAEQPGYERWWDGLQWTASLRPIVQQGVVAPHHSAYAPAHYAPTTDQRYNTAEQVIAWILAIVTFGYMLPWAVAASRGKSNSVAIALVNFFAGWTVIGWIVALVMACGAHQQRANVSMVQMVNAPHYPSQGPR
jgi:T4 superinfection immunity protein/uncharacterized protein DUF2510